MIGLKRKVAVLLGGDARRAVVTLVSGTTVAQFILIAVAPIVTRLYSPADVGAFSVAVSVMSILTAVSCLSYHYAIALPEDHIMAANILGLCMSISLAVSLLLGLGTLLLGDELLTAFGATYLSPYLPFILIGQTIATATAALSLWVVRMNLFKALAVTSVLQAGVVAIGQVGLGLGSAGAVGMLLGTLAGYAASAAFLWRVAWRNDQSVLRKMSVPGMISAARRYRRFAILTTPSVALNTFGLRMPLLTTVALYGAGVGGQFALADRVVGLPVSLVAGAVGQVYYSQASAIARDNPPALRALFWRTTRTLAALAIAPAIILGLAAPFLFELIFGPDWRQAGVFVTIMVPWFYLILITNPTGSTLDVLERQDLHLAREVLRIVLFAAAAIVAGLFHLSADGSVVALSVAGCLTYAAYGLVSWHAIVQHRPHAPTSGSHTAVGQSEALSQQVL